MYDILNTFSFCLIKIKNETKNYSTLNRIYLEFWYLCLFKVLFVWDKKFLYNHVFSIGFYFLD